MKAFKLRFRNLMLLLFENYWKSYIVFLDLATFIVMHIWRKCPFIFSCQKDLGVVLGVDFGLKTECWTPAEILIVLMYKIVGYTSCDPSIFVSMLCFYCIAHLNILWGHSQTTIFAFLGSSRSEFVVSGSLFGVGQFITRHQGEALRLLRERATV